MQSGLPLERDFRHIKSDDLDLRPVFHRLDERVKAHVLICMLACYLTWHLNHNDAPSMLLLPQRCSIVVVASAAGWCGRGR